MQVLLPFDHFVHNSSIRTRLQTCAISRQDYSAYLAASLESSSIQLVPNEYSFSGYTYLADIVDIEEPKTFRTTSMNPLWKKAMQEEFDALKSQGTWVLVPVPSQRSVVRCKWVYKVKMNSDGSISRYKARLVAQGFTQEQGIDYSETFSPVVRHSTVRLILALATSCKWPLRQLDIKNAFLHGELQEEVYMQQPQGFVDSQHPKYVCRLLKSLYGLNKLLELGIQNLLVSYLVLVLMSHNLMLVCLSSMMAHMW